MAETIKTITDATWPKLKTKAAEMGITPPVMPTSWAGVHSEINGFADRAAARVAALTPAPVVVAPAPPVPAPAVQPAPRPAPGSWPTDEAARANAVGLADVWAKRQTAGAPAGPKRRIGVDALLKGSVLSGRILTIHEPAAYEDWDFSGVTVERDPGIEVSFLRSIFATDPTRNDQCFRAGLGGKTTMKACTINQWRNTAVGPFATNAMGAGDNFEGDQLRFEKTAVDMFNFDRGTLRLTNSYAEAPAQRLYLDPDKPWNNDHSEDINLAGGDVWLEGNLLDCLAGGDLSGGSTGILLFQARVAALRATVRRNIMLPRNFKTWWAIQAGDDAFGIALTFEDNLFQLPLRPDGQPGRGGILAYSGDHVTGSGNRDWDTGAPLDQRLRMAA